MRTYFKIIIMFGLFGCKTVKNDRKIVNKSFYNFEIKTLEEQHLDLSQFRGKKILIVNTASKCGLTPQLEGLQKLYSEYKDKGFVIIGFPANDFLKQEPKGNKEIAEFCTRNYGVEFPMTHKITVKGKDVHPIFSWLVNSERTKSGKKRFNVKWNFHKFLVNEKGEYVGQLSPKVLPKDERIKNWILTGKLN